MDVVYDESYSVIQNTFNSKYEIKDYKDRPEFISDYEAEIARCSDETFNGKDYKPLEMITINNDYIKDLNNGNIKNESKFQFDESEKATRFALIRYQNNNVCVPLISSYTTEKPFRIKSEFKNKDNEYIYFDSTKSIILDDSELLKVGNLTKKKFKSKIKPETLKQTFIEHQNEFINQKIRDNQNSKIGDSSTLNNYINSNLINLQSSHNSVSLNKQAQLQIFNNVKEDLEQNQQVSEKTYNLAKKISEGIQLNDYYDGNEFVENAMGIVNLEKNIDKNSAYVIEVNSNYPSLVLLTKKDNNLFKFNSDALKEFEKNTQTDKNILKDIFKGNFPVENTKKNAFKKLADKVWNLNSEKSKADNFEI